MRKLSKQHRKHFLTFSSHFYVLLSSSCLSALHGSKLHGTYLRERSFVLVSCSTFLFLFFFLFSFFFFLLLFYHSTLPRYVTSEKGNALFCSNSDLDSVYIRIYVRWIRLPEERFAYVLRCLRKLDAAPFSPSTLSSRLPLGCDLISFVVGFFFLFFSFAEEKRRKGARKETIHETREQRLSRALNGSNEW